MVPTTGSKARPGGKFPLLTAHAKDSSSGGVVPSCCTGIVCPTTNTPAADRQARGGDREGPQLAPGADGCRRQQQRQKQNSGGPSLLASRGGAGCDGSRERHEPNIIGGRVEHFQRAIVHARQAEQRAAHSVEAARRTVAVAPDAAAGGQVKGRQRTQISGDRQIAVIERYREARSHLDRRGVSPDRSACCKLRSAPPRRRYRKRSPLA